jgi:hypothetical protein
MRIISQLEHLVIDKITTDVEHSHHIKWIHAGLVLQNARRCHFSSRYLNYIFELRPWFETYSLEISTTDGIKLFECRDNPKLIKLYDLLYEEVLEISHKFNELIEVLKGL